MWEFSWSCNICPSKIFASHQLKIWFSHASAIINFTWGTWKIMALTVDFALMKNESNLPELSLERCSVMSIRCSLFIVCWIIHFSRDVIPSLSRNVPMLLLPADLWCDASSENFESRKNVETFSDVIIAEVLTQSVYVVLIIWLNKSSTMCPA